MHPMVYFCHRVQTFILVLGEVCRLLPERVRFLCVEIIRRFVVSFIIQGSTFVSKTRRSPMRRKRREAMIRKIIHIDEDKCNGCGLEMATKNALQASGKFIPWQVVTISRDGRILD